MTFHSYKSYLGRFQNLRQERGEVDPAGQRLRQGAQHHLPPDHLQGGVPVPGHVLQDQGDPGSLRVLPGLQPDPDGLPKRVHKDGHFTLLSRPCVHL